MFSFPKEKKRKEQPKLHDLAFLLILRTLLQPALFFLQLQRENLPLRTSTLKLTVFLHQQNAALLEKVLICREGSLFQKKKKKRKRELTTSTSHSFSHCKSCSLRFFLLLQREKLPFGPLLASLRFSLQLQDFAAVSMETAALRVQKAKSCSRVTRALAANHVRRSVSVVRWPRGFR